MFSVMSLDIFKKEKPTISVENRILPLRPNLTLNSSSFPICLTLQDTDDNNFNLPNYFTMEAISITNINNHNGTSTYIEYLEIVLCQLSHFPLLSNQTFYDTGLNLYYCIKDQNVSIGGFFDAKYTKYLTINIKLCKNSTNSSVICAPEETIKKFLSNNTNYFWNLYFQNTILNAQNYSDPKSHYIINMYKEITYGTFKIYDIFLKTQSIISDNGFFLESNEKQDIISYASNGNDFSDMGKDGLLCSIYLYSSNSQEIFHRSYLKITFVLANVGALGEVFMHLLRALCYIFTLIKMEKHILNKIFDFDLIKKDSKIENKSVNLDLRSKTMNMLFSINSVNNVIKDPPVNRDFDALTHKNIVNNYVDVNRIEKFSGGEIESRILQKRTNNILIYISKNNKKEEMNFTYFEIVRIFCCKCSLKNELKEKVDLYDKAKIVLDDYLDINYIINKFEEFEKLKLISLTYEQLSLFNYIAKDFCTMDQFMLNESKFNKFKNMDKDKNKLAEIISIFLDKVDNEDKNLTEIDYKIYDLLKNDLKK